MKKLMLLLPCVAFVQLLMAQFTVRLVVTDVATRKNDDIYLSGSFNNFNPKDESYKLKPFGGSRKSIVLKDISAGNYAFKFTRGSLDKVECMADGRDISDRVIDVSTDMSLEISIAGWKDDYPERPKRYSASPQVKIMDTAFKMPQLSRTRRIWVYLPKGYATSGRIYPVLYMQDGQNLFNQQTAANGEWGVDECLDTLGKQLDRECIVVGIDNGGAKNMGEYCPYDFSTRGYLATPDTKGEGKEYLEFIVKTLKPYIDGKYKTQKGRDYTFIAGSGMGAVISGYAMFQYPEVFGAAGMFSPAFSVAPDLFTDAEKAETTLTPRFFLYAGGRENGTMLSDVDKMDGILSKKKRYEIEKSINPIGEHSEKYWQQAFPEFYTWLMHKD